MFGWAMNCHTNRNRSACWKLCPWLSKCSFCRDFCTDLSWYSYCHIGGKGRKFTCLRGAFSLYSPWSNLQWCGCFLHLALPDTVYISHVKPRVVQIKNNKLIWLRNLMTSCIWKVSRSKETQEIAEGSFLSQTLKVFSFYILDMLWRKDSLGAQLHRDALLVRWQHLNNRHKGFCTCSSTNTWSGQHCSYHTVTCK